MIGKYNINASHLQALPLFKPDDSDHDALKRDDLVPLTTGQLDHLIMAAKDAWPELSSKNKTLSFFRTDTKGRSAAYANWFQNPVIVLDNANGRFENLHDKVGIIHEMCHMAADLNGHLDKSSEWSALELPMTEFQQIKTDFRSGKISKDDFLEKKSAFEKTIPAEFASDYGSTYDQEDFAETCVATCYGVTEGGSPSANLRKKLDFVAKKLFSGTGHQCSENSSSGFARPKGQELGQDPPMVESTR